MDTPTVVRQTKDYLLIKIPLPKGDDLTYRLKTKGDKTTTAEQKLWKIIQEGEKEHRLKKTITARSSKEALRIYERRKNKKD